MREITIKYHLDHRKHRHELVEQPKSKTIEFLLTKNEQSE